MPAIFVSGLKFAFSTIPPLAKKTLARLGGNEP